MTHHNTIHALKSRFEKIRASFDIAITWLDSEDIHAFRVEIKKLRAFLHLISPGEKIKLPRRLHQFYRIAGKIRNIQLQQHRIREAFPDSSNLPQTYLTLLSIEAANHIRQARNIAAEHLSFPAEEQRLLWTLPNRITGESVRSFTRDRVDWLQTFSDPFTPVGNDALHSLRKCLKDLIYNRRFIQKEAVEILPFPDSAEDDTLDTLVGLLGQYQDLRTGLLLLRPCYVDQVPDPAERKVLETIRTQWENEKAKLKRRILDIQLRPGLWTPQSLGCVQPPVGRYR